MKSIPAKFRNATIIRETSLERWQQVLVAAGYAMQIDVDNLNYEVITQFICDSKQVDEVLFDAVKTIFELGESTGRGLIEDAAENSGINLNISDEEPSRDLAARVWVESRKKRELLQILARAHVAFEYLDKPRNIKEFAGEKSFPLIEIDTARVETMVSDWCEENRKSGVVDVFVYQIENNWCCDIVRGDPVKKVAAIDGKRQTELTYQPAVIDHIRIEPTAGRIGVLTRSPSFVPLYREVFGELLTGEPSFFSGENICSLAPLQTFGKTLLTDNLPIDIHQINLTELRWRRGGKDQLIIKGLDCYTIINDLAMQLKVGQLVEAKLQFKVAGETRPVRVSIKTPNKIIISNTEYETTVNRFLDCVGIRGRFDTEETKTFWQLYPWLHSETAWRQQIGNEFDNLKSTGCLYEQPLSTLNSPGGHSGPHLMDVEFLSPSDAIAVNEYDKTLRKLTPSDFEGYQLQLAHLMGEINTALKLKSHPQQLANGMWSLGYREMSNIVTLQIFLASQAPSVSAIAKLEQSLNGYQPVLILPDGCSFDTKLPTVHCNLTALHFDDLLGDIVKSLQLQNVVEPTLWCNADFIINTTSSRLWLKGVEIDNVEPGSHPYKLALLLAQSAGSAIKMDDLNSHLSYHSTDPKVANKARSDLSKKMKANLIEKQREDLIPCTKDMIKTRKGAYIMQCTVKIL